MYESSYLWTTYISTHCIENIHCLSPHFLYLVITSYSFFITPILKSLVVPVIWLALIGAIYSWIAPFFALQQPIIFQGLYKVTNLIARKWKTKSIMWQINLHIHNNIIYTSNYQRTTISTITVIDNFQFLSSYLILYI